jgi:hypothetical protein
MLRFGLGRAFASPNTVVKLAPEGCPDAAGTMGDCSLGTKGRSVCNSLQCFEFVLFAVSA